MYKEGEEGEGQGEEEKRTRGEEEENRRRKVIMFTSWLAAHRKNSKKSLMGIVAMDQQVVLQKLMLMKMRSQYQQFNSSVPKH